jgi:predicted ATPase
MRLGGWSYPRPRSFRIKNFRSVGDEPVEIELGKKITILIGLNNSGKSNIIRAMDLATYSMSSGHRIPRGMLPIELQDDDLEEESSLLDIVLNDVDTELHIKSILDEVISNYYSPSPGVTITDRIPREKMQSHLQKFVDRTKGGRFILRRRISKNQDNLEISSANLVTEPEDVVRNAWTSVAANLGMRLSREYQRFLQLFSQSLSISSNSLPIGIPSEEPSSFIGLKQLRREQMNLENCRSKIYLLQKDNVDAFNTLEKIITSAFPNYESIVPEHDDEDNTTVVYLESGEKRWELGIQGDGIKRMIMFFLFLVSMEDTILLVDEPEMHLHPNMEDRVIDYFLRYGKSQLIMATHSEIVVNSVPPELIDNGDIVINWLWLDKDNQTVCTRSSKSDVVDHLMNLGVPTNGYLLHMYAHSSKRVFVEGKDDHKYIKLILKKFNYDDILDRNNISFIEYEGKSNLHKIDSSLIDAALKAGEGQVKSPPVSCLFIRDKDESVRKLEETNNLMILSVREIENTVLSEKSIRGVVSDIIERLELDNYVYDAFEEQLSSCIKDYLNRWALLKLKDSLESVIRPLLRKKPIDKYDVVDEEFAQSVAEAVRKQIEEALKDLKTEHKEMNFELVRDKLNESCFPDGRTLDYEFICRELPGKDLYSLVRDALTQTIFTSKLKDEFSEQYVRGTIGRMCCFDAFLHHTPDLPEDIKRFVERIRIL